VQSISTHSRGRLVKAEVSELRSIRFASTDQALTFNSSIDLPCAMDTTVDSIYLGSQNTLERR
jgi:hypothetical protein